MSSNIRTLQGARFEDRFLLLDVIGAGGMGVVYRARDEQGALDDIVVKIPNNADDADLVARFGREARRHAAIDHPNVVPVLFMGQHEGLPYLVMPHLAGGSLADQLATGTQSAPRVSTWLRDVAQALDAMHAEGVLHRDVKPSNVLFDERGRAHLVDFGISKGHDTTTLGGGPRGSLNFMPPEATDGRYEAPYDQYSLAATAYFALTGCHAGDDPDDDSDDGHTEWRRFWRRKRGRIRPPQELSSAVPTAVGEALLRGLSLNPEFRYASCAEFGAALATAAPMPDSASSSTQPSEPEVVACVTGAYPEVPTGGPIPFASVAEAPVGATLPPGSDATLPPSSLTRLADAGPTRSDPKAPPTLLDFDGSPNRLVDPESFAEGCFEVLLDSQPAREAPRTTADATASWPSLPAARPKRRLAPWIAGALALVLASVLLGLRSMHDSEQGVALAVDSISPATEKPLRRNEQFFAVKAEGQGELVLARLHVWVGGVTGTLIQTQDVEVSRSGTQWQLAGAVPVADGERTVQLELRTPDERSLQTWGVSVDATVPSFRVPSPPRYDADQAHFVVAIDEVHPTTELAIDTGACLPLGDGTFRCQVPLSVGERRTVQVTMVDAFGNLGVRGVDLDYPPAPTPPPDDVAPRFLGPAKRTQYVRSNDVVTLRGQMDDPTATVSLRVDGRDLTGAPTQVQSDGAFVGQVRVPEESSFHVRVIARDAAGNEASRLHQVIVDGTDPSVIFTRPRADRDLRLGQSLTIAINVVDMWPDQVHVRVYRGDDLLESFDAVVRATRGLMPPATLRFPRAGTYRIEAVARDRAGNQSAVATRTVQVRR